MRRIVALQRVLVAISHRVAATLAPPRLHVGHTRCVGAVAVPPPDPDDEDCLLPPPIQGKLPFHGAKVPRRKWMSVQDMVTEVDVALHKGDGICAKDGTYDTLHNEVERLRKDNDELLAQLKELKEARAKFLAVEDELNARLAKGIATEAELVNVTKHIHDVDSELAGLRRKHFQNVRDVGLLKLAMFKIAKRREVTALVDRVEDCIRRGVELSSVGPEATAITALVRSLEQESDKTQPKITAYEKDIEEVALDTHRVETHLREVRDTPTREADDSRMDMISHLNQVKRMTLQLTRLRDIQIINAHEIGMLERLRGSLIEHERIRDLLSSANLPQLHSAIQELEGDSSAILIQMREIEAKLAALAQETAMVLKQLRDKRDEFSAETGKLREIFFEKFHEEDSCRMRLERLRGDNLQKVLFLRKLKAACSE